MTRYLVDTNVISATAPTTAVIRPRIIEWMDAHSDHLFLSAVTVAEIADGIAKARRTGAKRKAADLSAWLRTVLHLSRIAYCHSMPRRRRLPAHWRIWTAAAVICLALQMSRLLQRPVAIT